MGDGMTPFQRYKAQKQVDLSQAFEAIVGKDIAPLLVQLINEYEESLANYEAGKHPHVPHGRTKATIQRTKPHKLAQRKEWEKRPAQQLIRLGKLVAGQSWKLAKRILK